MTSGDREGGRPGKRRRENGTGGSSDNNRRAAGIFLASLCIMAFAMVPLMMYVGGAFDRPHKNAETAPFFGPRQLGQLVEQLSAATATQGICYGWVIDSDRPRTITKVTPSYPGTFSPSPSGTPPSPRVPVGAPASPAPRATASGARPAPTKSRPKRSKARTKTPTRTRESEEEAADLKRTLRALDDPGVEFGSNLGPGVDPRQAPRRCPEWVVLKSSYGYLSMSKEFTSGYMLVESSFDDFDGFDTSTLERKLGQDGLDGITGDYGVARLRDAIGALPMLVAEEGLAPPVPARTSAVSAPPAGDELHTSRFTKRNVWTGIGVALIACAAIWFVIAAVRNLRKNRT